MGFLDKFKTRTEIVGLCFVCNAPILMKKMGSDAIIDKPKYLLNDGNYICPTCVKQKGIKEKNIIDKSKEELLAEFQNNGLSTPDQFSPSKRVMRLSCGIGDAYAVKNDSSYLELDEKRHLLNFPMIEDHLFSKDRCSEYILPVEKLIDFELLDSGSKIADGNSLIGAAAGGLIFGGAGAIVGSGLNNKKIKDVCTELRIKIVVDDLNNPTKYIDIIGSGTIITKVKRDSIAFRELFAAAQECLSILTVLIKQNRDGLKNNACSQNILSVTDEIKKYKELLDLGAITEDEYNKKKCDLLAL
jgi:hypothetical protein